ncbi:MAG: glycosyltransferase, partial [Treponema sp.]|nr:glycosyltransferase [Treponema sp.]
MKLLIIIPTYNEIENIESFIQAVFLVVPPFAGILVVDDGSPDGTADAATKLMNSLPDSSRLALLRRSGKQGLASAYLAGFAWGLERGFDVFLEM